MNVCCVLTWRCLSEGVWVRHLHDRQIAEEATRHGARQFMRGLIHHAGLVARARAHASRSPTDRSAAAAVATAVEEQRHLQGRGASSASQSTVPQLSLVWLACSAEFL